MTKHALKQTCFLFYLLVVLTRSAAATSVLTDLAQQVSEASSDSITTSDCSVPDELVEQLLTWIALNTDYDTSVTRQQPPVIVFCSTGETIPYEDDSVLVDHMLRGAYDLPNRTIFLVAPWNHANLNNQSVLLHELIHDVQHLNRQWECLQAPEWEAYKLQDQWFAEHGVTSDFNWLHIYLLAKCPRDVHP